MSGEELFVNATLSRKLEEAEARSCVDFVETRARLQPESRARWTRVEGAFAMFDGAESPLTQTFGLGMFEPATAPGLDRIEGFFGDLGAPAFHEVSPIADPSTLDLLNRRGYEPFEFTSVMFRRIEPEPEPEFDGSIDVSEIQEKDADLWADTSARGWVSESPALGDFMRAFGAIAARRSSGASFLGFHSGKPIAAAGLSAHEDVALFAGASTIPEGRCKGAQSALLAARLRYAVKRGCRIAMMCAVPGGSSQRNAERKGFRIAYTRLKWRKRSS